MSPKILIVFFILCIQSVFVQAKLTDDEIPAALKPWVGWVMYNQDEHRCPHAYSDSNKRICAWPATLELGITKNEGVFGQQWYAYGNQWVRLPGDNIHWPHSVNIDGNPTVVIAKNGFPYIKLDSGSHSVTGKFSWDTLPETITIPPNTGLLQLKRNDKVLAFPRINQRGQLWLAKTDAKTDIENALDVQIFRKIKDGLPLIVETRIALSVSGHSREVLFPRVLLDRFEPIRLESRLPTRINLQGDLNVQLRPGSWTIKIESYNAQNPMRLALPKEISGKVFGETLRKKPNEISREISSELTRQSGNSNTEDVTRSTVTAISDISLKNSPTVVDSPSSELWVFQADSTFRLLDIEGVRIVDARQTRLPKEWHRFPAYALEADSVLQLKLLQRGSTQPEPNQLRLRRSAWLDFDGKGYTFNDHINGVMTRGWRLSTIPEVNLGRVSINNKPQLITYLQDEKEGEKATEKVVEIIPGNIRENTPENTNGIIRDRDSAKGVEVRHGRIQLDADSRYNNDITQIPVSGWQDNFHQVETNLFLPPGWKLFSANGADNLPDTWLQRWTLLDLFMVLVIAFAIARIWSWQWGLFALITMTLIWHEPGAPKYIWLNLLAAIAILKALPSGKAKKVIGWYKNLSFVGLTLIMIPFAINEVRLGLYPQLNIPVYYDYSHSADENILLEQSEAQVATKSRVQNTIRRNVQASGATKQKQKSVLDQVDPNAIIQTGPGLPNWNFQQVNFKWNSPVNASQTLDLIYISPMMNLLLNFLRVALLLVLVARMLVAVANNDNTDKNSEGRSGLFPFKLFKRSAGTVSSIVLILLAFTFISLNVQAQTQLANESKRISPNTDASSVIPGPKLLNELKHRLLEQDDCLPQCSIIENMHLLTSENVLTIRLNVHSANRNTIPLPGQGNQWRPERVLLNQSPAKLARDDKGILWLQVDQGRHEIILEGRLPKQPQVQLSLPLIPKYAYWQGSGWTLEGIRKNNKPEKQLKLLRIQRESENNLTTLQENAVLPPLLRVERKLHLGLNWKVETLVTRLSPIGSPVNMQIPLLNNEQVLSHADSVNNNFIAIALDSNQKSIGWESRLPVKEEIELVANAQHGLVENWKLDISPVWHVDIVGIPQNHHATANTAWVPEWKPWPNESISLKISRPTAVDGRSFTIWKSELFYKIGKRSRDTVLTFDLRSSRGGQHIITLPADIELISVSNNNRIQPVRMNGRELSLPISPGNQQIRLNWRASKQIDTHLIMPEIDLGAESVNSNINFNLGRDRWVLLTGGPVMGPAVLFWGVLLVILLAAFLLGKYQNSPLKIWQWSLLGIGLSLVAPIQLVAVVGWLMALQHRPKLQNISQPFYFNTAQILLVLLTLYVFFILFITLKQGLLGSPDMQIAGNGSDMWNLKWYQDRAASQLPRPWVISVPLLVYKILMLLWALWLAFSLINWLKWGWSNFITGGIWKKKQRIETPDSKDSDEAKAT